MARPMTRAEMMILNGLMSESLKWRYFRATR